MLPMHGEASRPKPEFLSNGSFAQLGGVHRSAAADMGGRQLRFKGAHSHSESLNTINPPEKKSTHLRKWH